MTPFHHTVSAVRALLLISILFLGQGLLAAPNGATASYQDYKPLAIVTADGITPLLRAAKEGLLSIGEEKNEKTFTDFLLGTLFLPDFAGIDRNHPFSLFFLTTDPPSALPIAACLLPVEEARGGKLHGSLSRAYQKVSGGGFRCYTSPVDPDAPPSLYVAVVDNRALISPDLEGLRWLALKSRDNMIPTARRFRDAPLHITLDAPLASAYCRILSTLLPASKGFRSSGGNGYDSYLREGGTFLSRFSKIDLAIDADTIRWDFSARLSFPPTGAFAQAIATARAPAQEWRSVFPRESGNRSVSALPAFIKILPASNRHFLSDIATKSQVAGFHLLPSAPDADDKLFPAIAGHGAFAFISDSISKFVGSIALYDLTSPKMARTALQAYFSPAGGIVRNKRIASHSSRQSKGHEIFTYDLLPPEAKAQTSIEQSSLVLVSLLEMNHVEVAISDDKLIVARGRHGLVDRWIADMDQGAGTPRPVEPRLSPSPDGIPLGGGCLEPTEVVRGAFAFLPDFPEITAKLPPVGDGFNWAMTRSPRDLVFDFSLFCNELLSCLAIDSLNDQHKDDLMTRFLMLQMGDDKAGR